MIKFIPVKHRPDVTESIEAYLARWKQPDYDGTTAVHFRHCASHAYWDMVQDIIDKNKCTIVEARNILHKEYNDKIECASYSPATLICAFMMQFEAWQMEEYNINELYSRERLQVPRVFNGQCIGWFQWMEIEQQKSDHLFTLEEILNRFNYSDRSDLISNLRYLERWDLVNALTDDVIFGKEALSELSSKKVREEYEAAEERRKSALHFNIIKIYNIISEAGPTHYSVYFPYKHKNHNIPNCLCVMGDGLPIFRLEVLDPENVTRFKLAEVMDPWWGMHTKIGQTPGPGEGEYDFKFYDFNIQEGSEFGIDLLLEILESSVVRLNERVELKWKRKNK